MSLMDLEVVAALTIASAAVVVAVVALRRTGRSPIEPATRPANEPFANQLGRHHYHTLFVVGLDGRIRTWGMSAERLTSFPSEQVIGLEFPAVFHHLCKGWAWREMVQAVNRDGVCLIRGSITDAVRTERQVIVTFTPLITAEDRTSAYIALLCDEGSDRMHEVVLQAHLDLQRAYLTGRIAAWRYPTVSHELTWSPSTFQVFPITPAEVPLSIDRFLERVVPDDRARVAAAHQALAERGAPLDEVFGVTCADGELKWVRQIGERLRDSDGTVYCKGVMQDYSDEIALRARLQMRGLELEAIIGATHDAIVVLNGELRVVMFNNAAEQLFGIAAHDMLGRPLDRLIPERLRQRHAMHLARLAASPARSGSMSAAAGMPILGLHADGTELELESSFAFLRHQDSDYFVAVMRNVSERNRLIGRLRDATARQRSSALELVHAQEAERTKLSHELHDEFAQVLTVMKLKLGRATDPMAGSVLEDIDRLIKQVRSISLNLRPAALDHLGLAAAVRAMMLPLIQQTAIECELQVDGLERRFPPAIEITAYRLIQEAVTNILRHANATMIAIRVTVVDERLHLTVEDDGVGVETESLDGSGGAGLGGMRDRVMLLDGSITIQRRVPNGTIVTASLPLAVADPVVADPAGLG